MFQKRTTFQDSLFYDVSAWTFPLAFNLDYEENESSNNTVIKVFKIRKCLIPIKFNYAYLMEWNDYNTPKVLNKILKKAYELKWD